MVSRSILETAAVIVGSLGREHRVIAFKSGHSVGKVVTIEATTALGRLYLEKMRRMVVVLGDKNKGIYGMNNLSISRK